MAISPLNIQQIVAVIRQQITEPVRTETSVPTVAPNVKQKKSDLRPRTRQGKHNGLSKLIVKRVSALQVEDPERGRKAFRIFLESVLINELGENLINDPGFYQMIDDIQLQMESEPDIAKAMREATTQLLAGVDPINDVKS